MKKTQAILGLFFLFFGTLVYSGDGLSRLIEDVRKFGASEEEWFRYCSELPQYKYVARPTYRLFGGNRNPLISVPAAFAVTDYTCHQLLPKSLLVSALMAGRRSISILPKKALIEFLFKPFFVQTGVWSSLGIPLMIHKHLRNQENK